MDVGHIEVTHDCRRVKYVLARIGDKWAVLVVSLLGNGSMRFSELKRVIDGISQRMLTLTLRGLERDGMVTRTVHAVVPPRVDYELTPLGRSLLTPVKALGDWAFAHQEEVEAARLRFDRAKKSRPAAPTKKTPVSQSPTKTSRERAAFK